MKQLMARKTKDGLVVTIAKLLTVDTKEEVMKIIKQEGMKYRKQFSGEDSVYGD